FPPNRSYVSAGGANPLAQIPPLLAALGSRPRRPSLLPFSCGSLKPGIESGRRTSSGSSKMGGNVNNYTVDPSSDETAAAKLWAVYVSEAEKYDKALVESWKSDMEGLLIFAGLFSAILTAFLIESYKTLNSNSGDVTVHLLMQISQQLATSTSTNVSALLIPAPLPVPFTPAATSLICNALWFISLGFSLACAMLATLLQQWARDFLHKADLRSAPVIRARIFSYLYYGLQRFQMHTMVEVIPLLLHGSLLFFLCGLVAFLTLVNAAMALIAATLLVIVGGVYFGLTLLPSLYLDCPYHTPLSGTVWRVLQALKSIRRHRRLPNDIDSDERLGLPSYDVFRGSHPPIGETMIEAMSRTAMEVSRERSERDQRALVWTVKSLVDDAELEPFVEAIPDLLWGPDGPRHTYAEHIRCLAQNPDLQLSARIASLLDSCDAGILWLDVSKRRRITCYKALWAIASLSTFPQFSQDGRLAIDFSHVYGQPTFIRSGATNSDLDAFFVSAKAMMLWSTFCAVQGPLTSMRELLLTFDDNPVETSDLWRLLSTTRAIAAKFPGLVTVHETAASSTVLMPRLRQSLDDLLFRLPYTILFNYLSDSASLPSPPYRWNETRTTISVNRKVLFAAFHWHLEDCLNDVISSQLPRLNAASEPKMLDWVDTSISMLLSFWRPDDDDPIPRSILQFLNRRHSHSALQDVLLNGGHITLYLWRNFPSTLSRPLEWIGATNHTGEEAEAHTALWQLAYLELGPSVSSIEARLDILRSVLHAVEKPTS
ncbi:hypothetical protein C8R46DRAFT_309520, partial [Mycena filopes]